MDRQDIQREHVVAISIILAICIVMLFSGSNHSSPETLYSAATRYVKAGQYERVVDLYHIDDHRYISMRIMIFIGWKVAFKGSDEQKKEFDLLIERVRVRNNAAGSDDTSSYKDAIESGVSKLNHRLVIGEIYQFTRKHFPDSLPTFESKFLGKIGEITTQGERAYVKLPDGELVGFIKKNNRWYFELPDGKWW